MSTRKFSLRLLLWTSLATVSCSPSPLPPGSVRSEQWGLTAVVPPDLYVVFAGPARAVCDSAAVAADWLIVEPSGFARDLAAPDTVQVSFTRVPFVALAHASGFIVDDSTGEWRAAGSEHSGDAILRSGAGWQTLEGSAQTRIDFPNADEHESPFVFEDVTLSLARFESTDGCALTLSLRQVGGGPSVEPLCSSVQLQSRRRQH